ETAFLFAASGTGAMEAVVANVAHPGSKVLVVEGGKFGRRWGEIARAFECEVDIIHFKMGEVVDPARVAERAEKFSPDLITLTHVESSTGLRLDVEGIVSALPDRRALIALDAIASVGSENILMEEWGIDVLAGAGQKALAAPAGVSFVIAGQRAMEVASRNPRPAFYFSFDRYGEGMKTGDTPFTPAVHSVQLLHGSMESIRGAGIDAVFGRHEASSSAISNAFEILGMSSFPDLPSRSVQAFLPPEGISCEGVITFLGEKHGIIIAGGQDEMAGRLIRTGFPGIYSGQVLEKLVNGLAAALGERDLEKAFAPLEPVRNLPPLFDSPLT
ncbi:MAG: alanine--glyoxylate aminotransferase family protein, partial [Chrysiogenales bacterium]